MIKNIALIAVAVLVTLAVQAGLGFFSDEKVQSPQSAQLKETTKAANNIEQIAKQTFNAINAQYTVDSVSQSELKSLYRVETAQGLTAYMDATGEFLVTGKLLQIKNGEVVNLTEKASEGKRQALLAKLDPDAMIIFPATGATKAHITVFTDIDCGFCRKLHLEVPALNAAGVEVRYMGFPRAGVGSRSYQKLVTAWCSANQAEALTTFKKGGQVPAATCENPIAEQYQTGQRLGVNGTPAIFLESGELIPGYRPAENLIKTLKL